jgi:hypothetical protein
VKTSSLLFCMAVCVLFAVQPSSAQTVAVGNCRRELVSYSTISEAVAAVTPNSTVVVCPGTYPEQVTITTPLILKGLTSGGVKAVFVQFIFAQGTALGPSFGPVDVSNLVVIGDNGPGSGDIGYSFASGSIENVDVSGSIWLKGSFQITNTVNIRNSSIHDGGIEAIGSTATGFEVNLIGNSITSAGTAVDYESADGLVERNTIVLAGGVGILLNNFFAGMTAQWNTITGANVGIQSVTSEGSPPNMITHNNLLNNGTGILISGLGGNDVVDSNAIFQSATTAIDLNCSGQTTIAEHNTIFSAPIGIANAPLQDTVSRNTFYNVPTPTTGCQ